MAAKARVQVDRAVFRRLMAYFRQYISWIVIALLCSFFVAGATGATAYLVKPTMDKIFNAEPIGSLTSMILENDKLAKFIGDPPPDFQKEQQPLTAEQIADRLKEQWAERVYYLSLIPILFILVFSIKGVFRFIQNYILRIIGEKVIRRIRSELYEHYQRLSIDYYSDTNTGIMMSRITNDVNMMQRAVPSLVSLFREPVTMIGLAFVAVTQIWYLALIVFVIFPLTAYPIVKFGRKIRKYTKRGQEHMGDLNSVLKENFSGIRVIKAFGMEQYEIDRFDKENERVYQATKKRIVFDEISSPTIEAIGAIAGALVLYFGGWLVLKSNAVGGHHLDWFGGVTLSLTQGQFISFVASLGLMYEPLKKINKMNINFQSALAAAVRVFEVFDLTPSVVEKFDAIELPPVHELIQFRNLRFAYNSDWVLDGIDMTAARGQSIALVGSSGAGKTTLVNLIPRFYDTTKGAILIDGVDIRDVSISSLRSQIGMVTQETFLFADSVAANIAYGFKNADPDRIQEVARAAYAHDFIMELSEGYDTMVGELGVKLSGGQRQRLAIARALYKNAPILVLDEATSALDTESEQMVQAALENLMRGRTTFVIAHRLSTVRNVDRILVLKNGKVIEDGPHRELIALNGEYARLYNIQFSEQE